MFKNRIERAIALLILIALSAASGSGQEKKRLTFDQIFKNATPKLFASLPNLIGWADDNRYLEMKKKDTDSVQKVYAIDVVSGEEQVYRDLNQFKETVAEGIDPTSPAAHNEAYTRLIYTKDKDLYYLNTETREFKRLAETPATEEKNPTISPDGNHVAFTRSNNLFTIELPTGKETQYTTDGSDVVYNGWASWVYYEEILGRPTNYRAFWWSPDSRRLVFFRFDDSNVPIFPLFNSEGQHGSLENTRYPKAGDPNPEVKIGVVSVGGSDITWADFNEKHDQYFGTPFWTPDAKQVFTQWMNREQDTLIIYAVDPENGKRKLIYLEHQPSWIDWFEDIRFLKKQKSFILRSDKDGWSHLYLYSMDGKLVKRLTQGEWAVSNIEVVNEDEGTVYFTARMDASTRTGLYKAGLDGKGLERLTDAAYTNSVTLSPTGKYFTSRYSNATTPTKLALYRGDGEFVKELGDSKTPVFDEYELARTELFTIPTTDGYDLPALWTLPLDFDRNRVYPVLIEIYGGPQSPTVGDSWRGLRGQWLAMEGVIQMSVDHRGSGHFGKEGAALMHRNLGKWEMNDYIEAVKWLRQQPFVDTTKICITGGSYGGFVTCLALTYGADYFTHGIASFSVTDFKLYDSHYTERYMDTPAENPQGYEFTSAVHHADKYKGLLRIVHGTMDDNVHMQNSIQLIDKLEDLGKHFEFMLYPGGRHGWGGPKAIHSRNENYRFYYEHLLEKPFPEQLFQ